MSVTTPGIDPEIFKEQNKTTRKNNKTMTILTIMLVVFAIFQYIHINKNEKKIEQIECPKIEFTGDISNEIIDQSLKDLIIQDNIWEPSSTYDSEHKARIEDNFCKSDSLWDCCGEKIDLNDDDISEYIIFPTAFYSGKEAVMTLRGSSGNGDILIYGFIDQKWKLIGTLTGSRLIKRFEDYYTKGYFNLSVYIPMGVNALSIDEWSWNGEEYELIDKIRIERGTEIVETMEQFDLRKKEILDKIGIIR